MRRLVPTLLFAVAACGGGTDSAPAPTGPTPPPAETAEPSPGEHHGHGAHQHSDEKQPIGHSFENAEQWAKRFDSPDRDAWQKPAEVIRIIGLAEGMTVADIGAGTGYFLPHLSKAVGSSGAVLALDIEEDMVRYMTERARKEGLGNVTPRVVAIDDPALPAAGVDRVLLVNTWHHIPDRVAYAKKIAAGLAVGGLVIVVDYDLDAPRGPPVHHRLAPEAVVRELEQAGFNAQVVADETLPMQYVVIGTTTAG